MDEEYKITLEHRLTAIEADCAFMRENFTELIRKVDSLQQAPAQKWTSSVQTFSNAIISAVVAYIVTFIKH